MNARTLAAAFFPGLALLWGAILPSQAFAFTPDLSDLPQVAQRQLSVALVKSAVASAKSVPLKFAVGATLDATTADGSWDQPEPGVARWRLRVQSGSARSMSFEFSSLHLPPAAELWIYTNSGQDLQGPFTEADNGTLWSPLVRAEEAVIEARMPYEVFSEFSLVIAQAFHGYRDLTSVAADKSLDYTTNTAGSCQVNAACSQGDAWSDEIRSAVLLTISNETLCSGVLVNNTRQDNRGLILTANHCGVRSGNVGATRAYFNVQKTSCSSTAAGPVNQSLLGKSVLARTPNKTDTDYTLFELQSAPPSNFNARYAGWDVSTSSIPQSGVTIHHPSGDDKKISTFSTAARRASNVAIGGGLLSAEDEFSVQAWEVNWSSGTTEGGSSGAGLWNQNRRLVGTLSGGNGACKLLSPTQNNGASDYFARLDVAWTATSDTGTTLKQALDNANSGCTALDGKDRTTSATNCPTSGTGTSSSGSTDGSSSGGGSLGLGSLAALALLAGLRRRSVLTAHVF